MKYINIVWSPIFYLFSTTVGIIIAITIVSQLTNIFLK
jgi:hypothetical protein